MAYSIFLGWCSSIGYSKDNNHSQVTMSGTEVSPKRAATSPANKENKKPKENNNCPICSESATDDVLECVWCKEQQHQSCTTVGVKKKST